MAAQSPGRHQQGTDPTDGRARAADVSACRCGGTAARRLRRVAAAFAGCALAACATRPVNPPIDAPPPDGGYRYGAMASFASPAPENLVILAFSGGGTRAASFSYGVLEALRGIEITAPDGRAERLLASTSVITGVSGGSFTALAYGLYGERLFDEYESRFLKRDVEGSLLMRLLEPSYWGPLSSTGWGRSELAADYYDEILFDGATFADLGRKPGPKIIANATDLSSGARFYFSQTMFDVICSDLSQVRIARAAAASSAVPVALSPVTFNNYGGRCDYREPPWLRALAEAPPVERDAVKRAFDVRDLQAFGDGKARPYLHLVDGGVADNLALRGVLGVLEEFEVLRRIGLRTQFDATRRIMVVVVNSVSKPSHDWDRHEDAPGPIEVLLQAIGVPIAYYSYDAIEQLQDIDARWQMLRDIRDAATPTDLAKPAFAAARRVPDTRLFVVNVSFDELPSREEADFLNQLPTSFVLPGAAVDQLRVAAQRIVLASPALKDYLDSLRAQGYRVAVPAAPGVSGVSGAAAH